MNSYKRGQPFSLKIAVALLVLLAVLATLQYRWLGQVSDAEGQRMRANLRMAVNRFVDDFDAEVTRAFFYFFPDPRRRRTTGDADYFERLEAWNREAPRPDLIKNMYLVDMGESKLGTQRLEQNTGQLVSIELPDDFRPLVRYFEQMPGESVRRPGPSEEGPELLFGQVPAIVVPDILPRSRMSPRAPRPFVKLIILELDRQYLTRVFLPELANRYFGPRDEDFDYEIFVTNAQEPKEVVFTTQPVERSANLKGDAGAHFFSIRPRLVRRQPWPREERLAERQGPKGSQANRIFGRMFSDRAGGPWLLTVRHRAGSLEAALTRARTRNLFIGFAVLFLLAASVVMMVISTERAKELARQKIEFVAGVSHELKTPLSVIRSAGENLADGKIADPEQVRRYGSLVESEGRRLTDLVEQVLQFAGTQSLASKDKMSVVPLAEILEGALSDAQAAIREGAIELEVEVPDGLPHVKVDASAMRRAIQNLIDNAVKYAGEKKWIGIRAGVEGPEAFVSVEDKGHGIDKADLPHMFEPFYRGQSVGQIRGSGLGLSLVKQIAESHGGHVGVKTASERGSVFTIHLPIAAN